MKYEPVLFSDGTENFRIPIEPKQNERVRLRLRANRNQVKVAYLIVNHKRIEMQCVYMDHYFEYFEAEILLLKKRVEYYFEAIMEEESLYCDAKGVTNRKEEITPFFIHPGFETPDWAKGAVFYQIYVDRFCNGDRENDVLDNEYVYINEPVKKVEDWDKYPDKIGMREFYGGDLQGIIDNLDYLQELGVEVLYLNPIFVSPSNHKYDTQDYDYVDPHFGVIVKEEGACVKKDATDNKEASLYASRVTDKVNLEASNQLFIKLVEELHRRGMRIVLDGVFNHCGSFHKWLDREELYAKNKDYQTGAYLDKESPYRNYFKFDEECSDENSSYEGWWGYDTLPKLNYEGSTELFEDILRIARKWVSPPYNVDGWRLDVAADLGHSEEYNHYFYREFRKAVKEANPKAIILAEHYGKPESWLRGEEWDTVMNYDAFMEPVTWFLTGMSKHSDVYNEDSYGDFKKFVHDMNENMAHFNTQSLQVAMNELSNHDHSRFMTRTNHTVGRVAEKGTKVAEENINKGLFRAAVVMQMTWPGAPTLYYGDEAGVCGWTDPDNRRTYPWGKEDKELIAFHKDVIKLHKDSLALKRGSLLFLAGDKNVISYGRMFGEEKTVVAINCGNQEKTIEIPTWQLGIMDKDVLVQQMEATQVGYHLEKKELNSVDGKIMLTIAPFTSIILKS